jgi:hypothetical protein
LIGFSLATLSVAVAALSILYARAIGGFAYHDPLLMKIFRLAALLSLSSLCFGIGGVWRPSPLRWHTPACALAILYFWFLSALDE